MAVAGRYEGGTMRRAWLVLAVAAVAALTTVASGCTPEVVLPAGETKLFVDNVQVVDEWNDMKAPEGSTLVCVFFGDKSGEVDSNTGTTALGKVWSDVRLTADKGVSEKPGVMGYSRPFLLLVFSVPDDSSGFKLEWPGVSPVDLKPYVGKKPSSE